MNTAPEGTVRAAARATPEAGSAGREGSRPRAPLVPGASPRVRGRRGQYVNTAPEGTVRAAARATPEAGSAGREGSRPGARGAERRRSRTYPAVGYTTSPVLKLAL